MNRNEQKKRYLMAKVATDLYQLNPEYLSSVQRAEAEEKACRMFDIQQLILTSAAAAQVTPVGPDELAQAYQACVDQFESEAAFHQTMKSQLLSQEGFRQALCDQLMCDKVLDAVSSDIPPLDVTKARLYYQQHQQEFSKPATWEMSQILITVNDDFAENTRSNALRRIRDIAARARPKSFAQLAQRYSECPSAMNQGYLGWCKEGDLYRPVSEALHRLNPQEISPPVETEMGFHLVTYHQNRAAGQASFEEAFPFLQEKHHLRAKAFLQRQWILQLQSHASECV
ncbi:Putative peptidyl-prolyl cis-trans isomerase Cbf2 precursor [Vibrio aerogenes CECT 7868]|uniref:peptidylprolyl isomerase n=1 Tax=Vibrio aerogenes CECT 7868 TaxID=1216006 RepID=A0A1M5WY28_9VIBR|nr:peptidylprolyl isomerase [Vibrio aerogenes]SHH92509.1 Putative peptidyl-prolyl cis-trans isomerase Cbf2 precursor [Vibrio aerogenes CECT 7868]